MKEKILAFLVARLVGIQKSYLEGVADIYARTITEENQIEQTFNEGVLNLLKHSAQHAQAEGDRRANESVQTAITNYEKKHSIKDGKPVKQNDQSGGGNPNPQKKDNDDTPEWAKAIIESNKALSEKIVALEQEKSKQDKILKAQIALKSSKLPENLKQKWANRINVESETSIEDQVKELETEFNELHTTIVGSYSGKGLPNGSTVVTGEASSEELGEVLNKI